MIDRIFSKVLAVSASVLLLAGCTGDVYKVQAGMYDDYKGRVDTASSYESVKKLNNELNMALVSYVKGNSDDVALYHKEASKHKEGIKTLVKAETDYAKAYLNKVMGMAIQRQVDIYTEYTTKVNAADGYDALVKLNRSLSSAVSKLGSENSEELKKATAMNLCQEQLTALNKAGEAYKNAYIARITPYLPTAEAAIYEKYLAKLSTADGLESLKQLKLFLDKEIALFANENSMIQPAGADVAGKESVANAKEAFLSAYMEKVAMPLIAHQKNLYSGTAKVFASVNDIEELEVLKVDFVAVNKKLLADNAAELEYIASAIAKGNAVYRREMEEVNALYGAIDGAMARRKAQLRRR